MKQRMSSEFIYQLFALLIAGLVLMEYEDPIDTDKKK